MKTEQEARIRAEQRKNVSTEEMRIYLEKSSSELNSLTEFRSTSEEVGSCDHRKEPIRSEMRKKTVAVTDEVSTEYREIHKIHSIEGTVAKPKEKLYEDIRPAAKDVKGLSAKSVSPPQIKKDLATPSSSHHSPLSQSTTASPPSQSPLASQSPTDSPPSQSPTASPSHQSPPSHSLPKREVLIPEKTAEPPIPILSSRVEISCEKAISLEKRVDQRHVCQQTERSITALPVEDLILFKKPSTHAVKMPQATKMVLQRKQVDSVGDKQAPRARQSMGESRAVSPKQETPVEQQHPTPKSSPQRQDSKKTKQLENIEEPKQMKGIQQSIKEQFTLL